MHKKGDKRECKIYSCLTSLLSIVEKVFIRLSAQMMIVNDAEQYLPHLREI